MESPKDDSHGSFTTSSRKLRLSEYAPVGNYSHSSSPSKYYSNGIQKFHITQDRKMAVQEVENANNRINQLIKFEEKAKKKIEIAQKKTELIQKAKERHENEIKNKELQKELKKQEEEEQRKKNREEKEKRLKHIENCQEMIINEKKKIAVETKRQSRELDALQKHFKKLIEQQKNERKNIRYTEVIEHKQKKDIHLNNYNLSLKEEYERRIAQEKAVHIDLINRKKELEKYEVEIIQKLENTEHNQVEALKNLEALAKVSLFHLGLRP
jgi:hypothetical protein